MIIHVVESIRLCFFTSQFFSKLFFIVICIIVNKSQFILQRKRTFFFINDRPICKFSLLISRLWNVQNLTNLYTSLIRRYLFKTFMWSWFSDSILPLLRLANLLNFDQWKIVIYIWFVITFKMASRSEGNRFSRYFFDDFT